MRLRSVGIGIAVLAQSVIAVADFPRFEAVTVDPNIGNVCYAVATADVNGDGNEDVVAVSENRVQWYENPTWVKHVILEDQTERDNVCLAPVDIDGDGQVDFGLGAGWTKIGTIQWIGRTADPDANWAVHFIGKELSTHRMSFADVLGVGKPQLVVSPLNKSVAEGARLTAFEIPANPRDERWTPTILDDSLNRVHAHTHVDWDGKSPIDTLTASEEGIHLIRRSDGGFTRTELAPGANADNSQDRGAGEIKVGRWGKERLLATIEPMHGDKAVVYLPSSEDRKSDWTRIVLDDTLKQGHAVWTVDLTGDDRDEIVIGHREPGTGDIRGPGLYVFESASDDGQAWKKHVIDDGGCAVEDARAADLNGDGRPDLIAGGRATHNVRIYWNRGTGGR
jgi:hypothetical protein